jgi:DNA-binding transcriptional MocR family regulator
MVTITRTIRETPAMTSATFDFAPLLPAGLPAPAAKWTGLAKYSFVGGNNDPDGVPVEGLIDAVNAVLLREGRMLATYGLASGPEGYRPLREFLTKKLRRDAGIDCVADDILIVSGSLQALDLVNATLLARGDTVIIERDTYQGALNRLTRLGVNAVGIPLDQDGMRMDALAEALADLKRRGITPKYIYTIPTVQNPTGTIMPEARRAELLNLSQQYGVPIFEDDCYADLIWDGKRPPALYAMSRNGMLGLADLDDGFFGERRGRAGLHAGAAGDTFGAEETLAHAGRHPAVKAASGNGQCEGALHLLAGADAARADDAFRGVVGEVGVRFVLRHPGGVGRAI